MRDPVQAISAQANLTDRAGGQVTPSVRSRSRLRMPNALSAYLVPCHIDNN
jgi:hypothetical protein